MLSLTDLEQGHAIFTIPTLRMTARAKAYASKFFIKHRVSEDSYACPTTCRRMMEDATNSDGSMVFPLKECLNQSQLTQLFGRLETARLAGTLVNPG